MGTFVPPVFMESSYEILHSKSIFSGNEASVLDVSVSEAGLLNEGREGVFDSGEAVKAIHGQKVYFVANYNDWLSTT